MNCLKKINWGDEINQGDILYHYKHDPYFMVVQSCSEMTGITRLKYISSKYKKYKVKPYSVTFGFLVHEFKKLIDV